MKKIRLLSAGILVGLSALLAFGVPSSAQSGSTSTPSGITVSPAFAQINLLANETEHPVELRITNNLSTPRSITLSTQDFNTLDESGGLFFVGTNPSELEKKYGLITWLSLPQQTVALPPKQTVTVRAVILNQASLAPGGHYGALMLKLSTGPSSTSGPNKIAVNPIASSLLFVNKIGGEQYKLNLLDVQAGHNIFQLPGSVELRFRNDGNTHLIPRGIIKVTDPKGKLVSSGVINDDSSIILPERTRRLNVPLNQISHSVWPGKYKLTINYRFDGFNGFRTYQSSFLIVTPSGLILLVLILAAIAAAAYYVLGAKRRKDKK